MKVNCRGGPRKARFFQKKAECPEIPEKSPKKGPPQNRLLAKKGVILRVFYRFFASFRVYSVKEHFRVFQWASSRRNW